MHENLKLTLKKKFWRELCNAIDNRSERLDGKAWSLFLQACEEAYQQGIYDEAMQRENPTL